MGAMGTIQKIRTDLCAHKLKRPDNPAGKFLKEMAAGIINGWNTLQANV